MALRATTLRLSDDEYEFLMIEAQHRGESLAHFLRVAGLARAAFSAADRGAPMVGQWLDAYAAVQPIVERHRAAQDGDPDLPIT